MTRWEILEKAKEVLEGEHGDGDFRKWKLKEDYKPIQKVVDAIIEGEDHISKEIEKHKEEIRKLESIRKKEKESRPVIADGVEYDSYVDYLKSREGEE